MDVLATALDALGQALTLAGSMAWSIMWALVLGFFLSAVVQAVVRRETIVRVLGDDRPATLARAVGLGAASSSCSYAAVALARSLFVKGAHFTAAIAFQIASTNLVAELGVILALLMGWQFTAAEFVGGPVMIVLLAVLFRLVLRGGVVDIARQQAQKGMAGSMEGHAAMDMSVGGNGPWWRRLASSDGLTSVSQVFVMEWAAIWKDLVVGILLAAAIGAWVPDSFWQSVFLSGDPVAATLLGPLVGPLVGVLSFVCSVGNIPLAVVLWKGGISFGGVVAFVFADLMILPILAIYRRYYGWRMTSILAACFYVCAAIAGYVIGLLFEALGLVPDPSTARLPDDGVSWDYTTWLNIATLVLAVLLVVRFVRSGGTGMLRRMGGDPEPSETGRAG